jgi:hypothetical protein
MREFKAIEEAKQDVELNSLAMRPQYLELLNLATWVPLTHAPRKIAISAQTLHISNSFDGVLALQHTHHTLAIDVKQPSCNYDKNNPKH